ncbi:MAG TPA: FixH family protein [Blastocatellia bacterium]|nr:FixH family protein [Blastocatellia bacterium]
METTNKPGKSLWGYGVTAVYTIFALATLGFVAFTMTQKVDLVAPDYYAQEIAYEGQINRLRQTQDLAQQITCTLTPDRQFIQLQMPPQTTGARGRILLYRPSSSALDWELELAPQPDGTQNIPTAKLPKGAWRVKVTWSHEGREFYNEFLLQV